MTVPVRLIRSTGTYRRDEGALGWARVGVSANLLGGMAEDWEDDMTTFITQARFTKEGFNAMIAAPEDRAEIVGRLIAEVGGKLIAYYLTSGEYDILLIFEGPSYEDTVPALIVAAAESGVADLKTVRRSHRVR